MANQYETRENVGSKYYPFEVWDVAKNRKVSSFPNKEEAQAKIEALGKPMDWNSGVAALLSQSSSDYAAGIPEALPAQVQPEPEEAATFTGTQYTAGDEIIDEDGNVYIATQNSYYISSSDAADTEDGFDVSLPVGWHTPAKLKKEV